MDQQIDDTKRVVQNAHSESVAYLRQLHLWLGFGSAGGAISLASLAGGMEGPAHAFEFFLFSFWLFLLGIVSAGGAVFSLAMKSERFGEHHAYAHNRNEASDAISAIPEIVAYPERLAREANTPREALIMKRDNYHEIAELAWTRFEFWARVWSASLAVSSVSFVLGFGWPLFQMTVLDRSIIAP